MAFTPFSVITMSSMLPIYVHQLRSKPRGQLRYRWVANIPCVTLELPSIKSPVIKVVTIRLLHLLSKVGCNLHRFMFVILLTIYSKRGGKEEFCSERGNWKGNWRGLKML
jgi:hypothetical protein